jgi:phosphohistidine phosphatase SixA
MNPSGFLRFENATDKSRCANLDDAATLEVSAPGGDVDRALDNIGRAEVTSAAAALALFEKPTRLIVSSARRTRETAAILVQTLALQSAQIEYLSELYLASAATLQRVIEMQPDDHTQLCLIGHNPGLSDFVLEALPAGSQREAYRVGGHSRPMPVTRSLNRSHQTTRARYKWRALECVVDEHPA